MSVREPCAPVEIISDHRQTVRMVVDMTLSDEETMTKAAWHMQQAADLLAPLNREAEWRLDARRAACSIDDIEEGGER